MSRPPSDQELLAALGGQVDGRRITGLRRMPYRYATSAPLEELELATADGPKVSLILKDLARETLLPDARASKPEFVYDPRREVETYRRIIGPAGIGPRCFAAVSETRPARNWLVLEKVSGVELWQVGELSVWAEVASWLGRLHARYASESQDLRKRNPYLLDHSPGWFSSWCERAREALGRSADPRAQELLGTLEGYDRVVAALSSQQRTFVHGEMYPSNVLVARNGATRTFPVDWEMAAVGSGLIDLAALVGGWGPAERRTLVDAYRIARGAEATVEDIEADLARFRLHLALQWLGWSSGWRPPPEHAHDWTDEALTLTRELGLS